MNKRKGGYREVSKYSLHIQCAWRFFKRECEEGHLVMTGVGIDLEELNS